SYIDMLQRVKELCRYLPGLEGETRSRYCSQVVTCAALVLFRSAFLYVSAVQPSLFQEFKKICAAWKTESWLWFRIFLTDMIIYQGHYRKALSSLHQMAAVQQPQPAQQSPTGQASLEHHRALIQQASCHYALGEYRMACEKLLDVLRAFTDSRDDLSLGHVVVLLQHDWPQGEMLFLKAVDKICQQGSFQYENFFNYVTSILICNCNHNTVKADRRHICMYYLFISFSVMSGMLVSLRS
ncbi:hypothetical protein GOODEAATRI_012663, partial [Goodea atripinnis]